MNIVLLQATVMCCTILVYFSPTSFCSVAHIVTLDGGCRIKLRDLVCSSSAAFLLVLSEAIRKVVGLRAAEQEGTATSCTHQLIACIRLA